MVKIGIIYVKGSMPTYENFGYLPNFIVKRPEDIHRCDIVIIPPGYIVETLISSEFCKEILKYYENGGIILGICSGFQLLSNFVETKRRRLECIKILDVDFQPLICTDWVTIDIVNETWLFRGVHRIEYAFHAHTFAPYRAGNVITVGYSNVRRVNYFKRIDGKILSIACTRDERVYGILPHRVLDDNRVICNICDYVGIKDYDKHKNESIKIIKEIKREIGINTGIYVQENVQNLNEKCIICIASLMTSDGKTFITTGLATCLKLMGLRVYVLKLGGDVRDIHPALYMIKEGVKEYTCIKVRGKRDHYGWVDADYAIKRALQDYDVVIVEGVMGLLTGMSYRADESSIFSTLDFIRRYNIPYILVCSPTYGGIEDLYLHLEIYLKYLSKNFKPPIAVVVNKCYDLDCKYLKYIKDLCAKYMTDMYVIPNLKLEDETHPEIDLNIEKYAVSAYIAVSKYIDVKRILDICCRYFKNVRIPN